MARRFPVTHLGVGTVHLDAGQSRHVRDVMRLRNGDQVELFDSAGNSAKATIVATAPSVELLVERLDEKMSRPVRLTVAAATPKGARADWMIEKLSELDVAAFVPLESARTIVHPESGKLSRWERLASESAKQCRRGDIMKILPAMGVHEFCRAAAGGVKWCLSTEGQAQRISDRLSDVRSGDLFAAIGPEGGWTEKELATFVDSGFHMVALTRTILRIETAAIAIASLVMTSSVAMNDKELNA